MTAKPMTAEERADRVPCWSAKEPNVFRRWLANEIRAAERAAWLAGHDAAAERAHVGGSYTAARNIRALPVPKDLL